MFYDIFVKLCDEKGVSPSKAALLNDVSKTSVTRWKNGATPNPEILNRLSSYFGVSTDYLLGNTQIKKTSAEAEAEDNFLFALSGEVRDFTSEEKQEIIDYVKYLRQKYKK